MIECNCKNEDSLAMAQNNPIFILKKADEIRLYCNQDNTKVIKNSIREVQYLLGF
jgi:hypothetical protein